ncbi:MAG: hypothetical protein HC856_00180 [Pseudanabaena sp. RU_4_16]|nr:hypothetical protein [Pseudanabaena sp. SU_2_4]NJM27061.1 hypothetical protein [Pseudanabaena sp. RU_4_16]
MNITRVERDGVEFFTINATGESGMSESGLARLCGVTHQAINKLLQKSVATNASQKSSDSSPDIGLPLATSDLPESIRALQGKKIELVLGSAYKNVKIIRDDVCAGVIEYYALDTRQPTPEAKYALRQFTRLGIRSWIQGITGWQTEHEIPSRRVVRTQLSTSRKNQAQPQLAPQIPPPDAIELDLATIDLLTSETTQGSTYRLYLQLLKLEALEQRPAPMAIAEASNIKHSTFYTSIKHLQNLGLCPDWLEPKPRIGLEKAIRDRLHQELGGQVEAPTKFGPVDLLTATELIEVKEFPDWKTGLGQLLAKSSCYPSHTKRLHLFGRAVNLKNIQACCAEFDISVTVESEFLSQN